MGLLANAFLAFIRLKPAQATHILAAGLVIAALIYVGFAIVGHGSLGWIAIELAGVGLYTLFAVMGLYLSRWWLVTGWMAHPVGDIGLHWLSEGTTFTPTGYAFACAGFDCLVAADTLGVLLGLFNLRRQEHES